MIIHPEKGIPEKYSVNLPKCWHDYVLLEVRDMAYSNICHDTANSFCSCYNCFQRLVTSVVFMSTYVT